MAEALRLVHLRVSPQCIVLPPQLLRLQPSVLLHRLLLSHRVLHLGNYVNVSSFLYSFRSHRYANIHCGFGYRTSYSCGKRYSTDHRTPFNDAQWRCCGLWANRRRGNRTAGAQTSL